LAKALNLGRQLAGLVFGRVGASSDFAALQEQLSEDRVSVATSLLEELQSALPLRATAAVSGSLAYWQRWVRTYSAPVDEERKNLGSQGERWRGLLTGEIRADDLLDLQDYRQAIRNYVGQVAALYRKSPWLSGTVLAMLAATGAGIWAIVTYAPKGAAVVAAIIATVAGALGITWKTVTVTAGKAAALIERPMFENQLSEAVKIAAFVRPIDINPAQKTKLLKELGKKDEKPVTGKDASNDQMKEIGSSEDRSTSREPVTEKSDVMSSQAEEAPQPG
jgi:hypothetical protein